MPTSNEQGRKGNATNTKYTSPKAAGGAEGAGGKKQHTPRPITDKFDCYRVPINQAQNIAAGQFEQQQQQQPQFQEYYHFEQKIQATNTGQAAPVVQPIFQPAPPTATPVYYSVPYSKLQYNYETYGHQSAVPLGGAVQQGNGTSAGYPLPQVDPNYYYHYPGQGGGPYTSPRQSPVNYGHAPYASPWATEERAKSPSSSRPPPFMTKANEKDEVMQKVRFWVNIAALSTTNVHFIFPLHLIHLLSSNS